MLQQEQPDDYVVATGESHSVVEFLDCASALLGLDWKKVVEFDPRYLRPTEVNFLQGDASKAREKFGWRPEVSFEELVKRMVEHDLELARQETLLVQSGHRPQATGSSRG
jgi:GDPmannose 4,6-dehydratase